MKAKNMSGFTLIEIMVAMAIFALIAVASTEVLRSVAASNELSEQRFEKLQQLQRAMLTIERDLLQAVPRPIRIEGESNQSVMVGNEGLLDSETYGLAFVRAGWHNPQLMLPRSTLQAVAYRLQEGKLQRLYSNYVDNVSGYEPKQKVLLSDIEDFKLAFFLTGGGDINDEDSWEESYQGNTIPSAISITIVSKDFGEIKRAFLLSASESDKI